MYVINESGVEEEERKKTKSSRLPVCGKNVLGKKAFANYKSFGKPKTRDFGVFHA